jgi:hypothetical protein
VGELSAFEVQRLAPSGPTTLTLSDPATGRSGTLTDDRTAGAGDGVILFAFYAGDPTPVPRGGEFLDILLTDPGPDDHVTLRYRPGLGPGTYEIRYFDPASGRWLPAPAAVRFDAATGVLTVAFTDARVFGGTVFAIGLVSAVPVTVVVAPPVAQADPPAPALPGPGTASDVAPGVRESIAFVSQTQLTVGLTAAPDRQLATAGTTQGVQPAGASTGKAGNSAVALTGAADDPAVRGEEWWELMDEEDIRFWLGIARGPAGVDSPAPTPLVESAVAEATLAPPAPPTPAAAVRVDPSHALGKGEPTHPTGTADAAFASPHLLGLALSAPSLGWALGRPRRGGRARRPKGFVPRP